MIRVWLINFLTYFIFAGLIYCVLYFFLKKRRKIQNANPNLDSTLREFKYSFISLFIIAGFSVLIINDATCPYTLIYFDGDKYGVAYFIFSIILCVFIHDTYFYWTHRMLHTKFFKKIHRVHHKSTNPTPWAAFAFHPVEAFIQGGISIILPFTIPLHPLALFIFMAFSTFYNVYGHSGYELFPKFLLRSKVGRWFNSSVGHNMHHEYYTKNYGFYFRFWDIVMKTTHPKYNENVDMVINKAPKQKNSKKLAPKEFV